MGYTTATVTTIPLSDGSGTAVYVTAPPHVPTLKNKAGEVVTSAFDSLAGLGNTLLAGAINAITNLANDQGVSPTLPVVGSPTVDDTISASVVSPPYISSPGSISGVVAFNFVEDPYVSSVLDTLRTYLMNNLAIGGAGLSSVTETAMQDSGKETDLLLKQDEFDKTASEWAERNMLPDGELAFGLSNIEIAYQDKELAKSRKILAESQKIAIDFTHTLYEETKKIEKSLMDYFARMEDRRVQTAEAKVKASVQVADIMIKYYSALAEVDRHNATMYSAYVSALSSIAVSTADLQAALIGVQADFTGAEARVQEAQAEIDLYTSLLASMILGAEAQAKAALASGALSAIHVDARASSGEHKSESSIRPVADAIVV